MKRLLSGLLIIIFLGMLSGCTRSSAVKAMHVRDRVGYYTGSKFNGQLKLHTLGFLDKPECNEVIMICICDSKKIKNLSVDEARYKFVNLYLDLLNYFNHHKLMLEFDSKENVPLDSILFALNYGDITNFGVYDIEGKRSAGTVSILNKPERIDYFIGEGEGAFHQEHIKEAIEILQESNQIDNPRYLKWVN